MEDQVGHISHESDTVHFFVMRKQENFGVTRPDAFRHDF